MEDARPDSQSWLGRVIAQRYRLIGRLGSGSVAEVYLARHVLIERLSAIKILRVHLAREDELRRRFLQEARAVNRINHPNIVEITDYGEAEETAFLVMEYVPGDALARRLQDGPLGFASAVGIGLQIASALSRAHEMGVIHRDLTPANVLLVPRRRGRDWVKITDFGVAKIVRERDGIATAPAEQHAGPRPAYMAPELTASSGADPRSDLFSLGALMFECVAGRPPRGERSREASAQDLRASEPGVPEAFVEVVMALLAPDPERRPRDGFETFEILRAVAENSDVTRSRASIPDVTVRPLPPLDQIGYDRIAPVLEAMHAGVLAAAGRSARAAQPSDLEAAERSLKTARAIAEIVERDTRAIADAEERARAARAEIGSRLDDLARERSRTYGWASTLAERHDVLRSARHSGAHPLPVADALLWEQAALEREEARAYERASELDTTIASLHEELARHNEAAETDIKTLTAALEGHVAALRSIAGEAYAVFQRIAEHMDTDLSAFLGTRA